MGVWVVGSLLRFSCVINVIDSVHSSSDRSVDTPVRLDVLDRRHADRVFSRGSAAGHLKASPGLALLSTLFNIHCAQSDTLVNPTIIN